MTITFTKMHGLGNDFVVIEQISSVIPNLNNIAGILLNRRLGIGGDQLLTVEKSEIADFRMRIFNPDGSEVEMCGNGMRCFYKYLLDKGLTEKKEITVETLAGLIKPSQSGELISVNMGKPEFEGEKIPLKCSGTAFNFPLDVGGKTVKINCVSMGNPHAVVFVDDLSTCQVHELGPLIENHSFFPNRTNVEFVKVVSQQEIKMRVWERGAGETMACGTGACAAAIIHMRTCGTRDAVTVHLSGGDLDIVWNKDVIMTGAAATVFEGKVDIAI